MAAEMNFSPPEVPEPTFLENLLRYGLFLGAIFQLICVLAIIFPISKSHEGVWPLLPHDCKCSSPPCKCNPYPDEEPEVERRGGSGRKGERKFGAQSFAEVNVENYILKIKSYY
ncbi:protein MANBAL isoform X1 [Antechinus flavipes]|uniref:protein MANBAL isoform X1 n=1 Tax=Antechinus flavipes TaxID=38775 RepID=UPI002236014D|nr:protein MANBAL isoform X1 [Antechinus flavipes]XP_051835293.1 protein MANBAL isoform X1 [Antechinus flavipes]